MPYSKKKNDPEKGSFFMYDVFRLFELSELDVLGSTSSELLALLCNLKVLLHTSSIAITSSSDCAEVSSAWALALKSSSRSCVAVEKSDESCVEALVVSCE